MDYRAAEKSSIINVRWGTGLAVTSFNNQLTKRSEQDELHPESKGSLLLIDRPERRQTARSCKRFSILSIISRAKRGQWLCDVGSPLPECDDDGWGLGAGRDEGDDEEEDEKGDEGVAGAITLPWHGVAVLVQVRFDDDQLELVDLAAGGRSDDLSALHAAAVGVVPYL